MKPIHWLLIIAAFIAGMYIMTKLQPLQVLPVQVEKLNNRVSDVEHELAQHNARWSWINRFVDIGRKFLPWC